MVTFQVGRYLVFISLVGEHVGVLTITLRPASLESSMPSIVKMVVLHVKVRLLVCFVPNACLFTPEACPLLVRDQRSLQFTTTRVFMQMFRTGSSECQHNFDFL